MMAYASRSLHGGADRNQVGSLRYWEVLVAPFTGARIETALPRTSRAARRVAPFTGARIETTTFAASGGRAPVAPFTGARIETRTSPRRFARSWSLPSRGRGSKRRRDRVLRPHARRRSL